MKKCVLFGAYCQLTTEAERFGEIDPVAIIDDEACIEQDSYRGIPMVSMKDALERYSPDNHCMIACFLKYSFEEKIEFFRRAEASGYEIMNYISPAARWDGSITMGCGNVVFAGTDLGYDGKMGNYNSIRQNGYIGHEFVIGDYNNIAPACVIGGRVHIGNRNWIALGSRIRDNTSIGSDCLVGMGSLVVKSVESYTTVMGSPAKVTEIHKDSFVHVQRTERRLADE